MNCLDSFYMQLLQKQNLLIDEQKVNEPNPIYALGNVTKHVTLHDTHTHTHTKYIPGRYTDSISTQAGPSLNK